MPERDDETGKFRESYPPETFLESLRELEEASTREVSDDVGCKLRTAQAKLSDLEDEGEVESRSVGPALLWRLRD